MTEDDARHWITAQFGSARTDRLARFLDQIVAESLTQNLIAPSTLPAIWTRHALDSAQLITLAHEQPGRWLDIGTGAGFPGMVIALLSDHHVTMAEPRRLRAAFLSRCVAELDVDAVVVPAKVEAVQGCFATVSARAVAAPEKLLRIARHCATSATRWLLPRGRLTGDERATLRGQYGSMFHVEQSLSDPLSEILVLNGVA